MLNAPKVSDKTIKRIMAETDEGDYERRRATSENDRNRLIAEVSLLPRTFCHLRRCRRSRHCDGPAVHTLHRINRVRAQQAIGLTGLAYKTLPQCLADMSKEQYETTCRPFESHNWPDKLTIGLRHFINVLFQFRWGELLQKDHGIRLGWETANDNWERQYEEVMQVIRRPAPVSELDIPEWLVNFTWNPKPTETSVLDRIDVLASWSGSRSKSCSERDTPSNVIHGCLSYVSEK